MIAYNDRENKGQRGYMVNNNYDATSWTSVISPEKEFKINISDRGNHQIRLVAVHANGAVTTKRMHYSMTDGSGIFRKQRRNQKYPEIIKFIRNKLSDCNIKQVFLIIPPDP